MSGSEKNIDRIFREKLGHFDAEPPAEVWNSISEQLSADRKRKMIFWITRVAAGIAILAALSLSYFLVRNSVQDQMITGDETTTENAERQSGAVTGEKPFTDDKAEVSERSSQEPLSTNEFRSDYNKAEPIPVEFIREKESPASDGISQAYSASINIEQIRFIQGKSIQLANDFSVPEIRSSRSTLPDGLDPQQVIPYNHIDDEMLALNIPEEEKVDLNRWSIGTQVSPIYSYRTLNAESANMAAADRYNQSESGTFAYSGGVNVNYSPVKRLSIQSGVYYSKYGVSVENAYYFESNASADIAVLIPDSRFYLVDNSSGVIDVKSDNSVEYITNWSDRGSNGEFVAPGQMNDFPANMNSGEVIQNFEYIEIPMILRYRLIDRRIGFNFLGGLSTNLLVGSNAYYNNDGNKEKIGVTSDIKPFNYSSIMGVGIDYSISKRLNINLEPTFRYYLNSINESASIRSHPYSMGLFTGLRYSF